MSNLGRVWYDVSLEAMVRLPIRHRISFRPDSIGNKYSSGDFSYLRGSGCRVLPDLVGAYAR